VFNYSCICYSLCYVLVLHITVTIWSAVFMNSVHFLFISRCRITSIWTTRSSVTRENQIYNILIQDYQINNLLTYGPCFMGLPVELYQKSIRPWFRYITRTYRLYHNTCTTSRVYKQGNPFAIGTSHLLEQVAFVVRKKWADDEAMEFWCEINNPCKNRSGYNFFVALWRVLISCHTNFKFQFNFLQLCSRIYIYIYTCLRITPSCRCTPLLYTHAFLILWCTSWSALMDHLGKYFVAVCTAALMTTISFRTDLLSITRLLVICRIKWTVIM
jgi:hypothetical protein